MGIFKKDKSENDELTDTNQDTNIIKNKKLKISEKLKNRDEGFKENTENKEERKRPSLFKDEIEEESSLTEMIQLSFWSKKYNKYKQKRDKEKQDLNVYEILSSGAKPSIEYYVLTILSCIIATTGLIQGSTATIIGAMIVAPLMTPILAMSLGVIWGDFNLIKTSVFSIAKGVFWAVAISTAIAYIIPIPGFSEEILSRTRPSLFDIVVAIASGTVGAYGYANKKISNTLVGIAIAVALMPPLCTIGISLGTMHWHMALNATILFAINLVSISLSGAIIFLAMKIHPLYEEKDDIIKRAASQIILSIFILSAIAVPVGIFMYEGFMISDAKNYISQEIKNQLQESEILSIKSEKNDNGNYKILVTIIATENPDYETLQNIKQTIIDKNSKITEIKYTILKSINLEKQLRED